MEIQMNDKWIEFAIRIQSFAQAGLLYGKLCLFWDDKANSEKLEDVISQVAEDLPVKGLKIKYGVYENIDKNLPVSTICDYAAMAEESIIDNYDCDLAYYTEEMAHKRIYNQMILSPVSR